MTSSPATPTGQRKVIVLGATGMIGGIVLRRCLDADEVGEVTTIGRKVTNIDHAKLTELEHRDFRQWQTSAGALSGQHLALFCLGAYTGAVPDDEFRAITVDYTVAFAKALFEASPEATFCLLSGQGADATEKSRIAFARYKGMAENALLELGFPRVYIFRPGYIYPVSPRQEPNLSYRLLRLLYPLARRIYPNVGISSLDLAKAMVHAGLHGTAPHSHPILENRDIRALADSIASS